METKKLKIVIVDDNKSFRDAAKQFLSKELNFEIVAEASSGKEFLQLINSVLADIVLMDILMPELDGIAATKKWCLRNPRTKVIAVTMFTEKAYLLQLIESGFKGCVLKTSFFTEIVNAIEKVYEGGLYFNTNLPIN